MLLKKLVTGCCFFFLKARKASISSSTVLCFTLSEINNSLLQDHSDGYTYTLGQKVEKCIPMVLSSQSFVEAAAPYFN